MRRFMRFMPFHAFPKWFIGLLIVMVAFTAVVGCNNNNPQTTASYWWQV
jgi:hypothetical protein